MKNKAFKIILIVVVILMVISLGNQVVRYFYKPYKTETVFEYVVADEIQVKGVMARDEAPINIEKQGTMKYYCDNGSKVGKNSVIAKSFADTNEVVTYNLIERVDKEIAMLEGAQSQTNTASLLPEALNKQMNDASLAFVKKIQNGEYDTMDTEKYNYLSLSNRKNIIIGKQENYADKIAQLKEERSELESNLSSSQKSVKASASGYFANSLDGYEGKLTTDSFKDITVEKLAEMLDNQDQNEPSNLVGKLITSYDWKFAVLVDTRKVELFEQNPWVNIIFSTMPDREVPAQVEKIVTDGQGDKSVIVLSGDTMTEEISVTRFDDVQIQFTKYSGLKVPKEAIRVENEIKGVYVVIGDAAVYRKLDIIYETAEFAVSRIHWEDGSYLKLYDSVIVEGKDLYDNKHF